MWERFSYYGMRSLLVLYMTKYLLLADHSGDVVGLLGAQARARKRLRPARRAAAVVADLGPLYRARLFHADLRRASRRPRARPAPHRRHRRGADGDRPFHDGGRAAFPVRAVGADPRHRLLQAEYLDPGRRALRARRPRRDRAYSIFYVGINVGAFLAPLVCGTLGEEVGWHYGFAAAGVGMCIGLCIYLYALPHLPPDELHKAKAGAYRASPAQPRRMARHRRAAGAVRAQHVVLGAATSRSATPRSCGSTPTSTAASVCSDRRREFRRPGFSPSIRS